MEPIYVLVEVTPQDKVVEIVDRTNPERITQAIQQYCAREMPANIRTFRTAVLDPESTAVKEVHGRSYVGRKDEGAALGVRVVWLQPPQPERG